MMAIVKIQELNVHDSVPSSTDAILRVPFLPEAICFCANDYISIVLASDKFFVIQRKATPSFFINDIFPKIIHFEPSVPINF